MRQNLSSNNTIPQNYSSLLLVWLAAAALMGFAGLVPVSDIWAQAPDGASGSAPSLSATAENIKSGSPGSEQKVDSVGETPLAVTPAVAETVQAGAKENGSAVSDVNVHPCRALTPYNSLDGLLFQFYINLNTDCLFKMPVEDLEKAWGVKILSGERREPMNYYPLSETEFYNKPYKAEKDAFYIEIQPKKSASSRHVFLIKITKDYYEKHGTLFPEGPPSMLVLDSFGKDFWHINYVGRKWKSSLNEYWWGTDETLIGITVEGHPQTIEMQIFHILNQ